MPKSDEIFYSDTYSDNNYDYRHVVVPQELAKKIPKNHKMTETEWRNLSIQQSTGWVHYISHNPEPHVVCFRRPKKDQKLESEQENS